MTAAKFPLFREQGYGITLIKEKNGNTDTMTGGEERYEHTLTPLLVQMLIKNQLNIGLWVNTGSLRGAAELRTTLPDLWCQKAPI